MITDIVSLLEKSNTDYDIFKKDGKVTVTIDTRKPVVHVVPSVDVESDSSILSCPPSPVKPPKVGIKYRRKDGYEEREGW